MAILDAEHLLAIVVVASALAPALRRLHGRHQHFQCASTILLLAHDPADFAQHPQTQREEGINPGRLLANEPGAQHQPMRDDLGLLRRFAQNRKEISR